MMNSSTMGSQVLIWDHAKTQRLAGIDSELEQLARFTPRSGVGSLGYRSNTSAEPDTRKSIRIGLGEVTTVDEVVLVPALFRDSETGFPPGGFPSTFGTYALQT
ncbi:MAG: hypothetical protein P8R37_04610 [Opitutae bacterium]|nr:hypothetical protein [Opitutae bacterium]